MAYTTSYLSLVLRNKVTVFNENGEVFETTGGGDLKRLLDNGVPVFIEMLSPTQPTKVYPDNTLAKYVTGTSGDVATVVGNTNAGEFVLDSNDARIPYANWSYRKVAIPAGLNPHTVVKNSMYNYDTKWKRNILNLLNPLTLPILRRRLGR